MSVHVKNVGAELMVDGNSIFGSGIGKGGIKIIIVPVKNIVTK